MKNVSEKFKTAISSYGRQVAAIVEMDDVNNTQYTSENIVSVKLSYEGAILSSVMRSCEIELDGVEEIPVDYIRDIRIGIRGDAGDDYEYVSYGSFIVTEKKRDDANNSLVLTCYDSLVLSMVPYDLVVQYPVTVADYLSAICDKLGLELSTTEFTNSTVEIEEEKYDNTYTFRDVLDEIAQVAAGIIAISDNRVSVLYPNETGIVYSAENMVMSDGITIGQMYGAVNSVVLARTPQEDNIYRTDNLDEERVEIKIENNQIMDSHREDFIDAIYSRLSGLSFYLYEFHSFGYLAVDLCDFFELETLDGTRHKCLMLQDEITVTQGIDEQSQCTEPEKGETDYAAASESDRVVNRTILRVDKQEQLIESLVTTTETLDADTESLKTRMSTVEQTASNVTITLSEIVENGIDKVVTSTGYTFDSDGLHISKTGDEIENRIDNTGVYVERSGDVILQANADGVVATDVTARNYLIIGENSRVEDMTDDSGNPATAVFWIGGA